MNNPSRFELPDAFDSTDIVGGPNGDMLNDAFNFANSLNTDTKETAQNQISLEESLDSFINSSQRAAEVTNYDQIRTLAQSQPVNIQQQLGSDNGPSAQVQTLHARRQQRPEQSQQSFLDQTPVGDGLQNMPDLFKNDISNARNIVNNADYSLTPDSSNMISYQSQNQPHDVQKYSQFARQQREPNRQHPSRQKPLNHTLRSQSQESSFNPSMQSDFGEMARNRPNSARPSRLSQSTTPLHSASQPQSNVSPSLFPVGSHATKSIPSLPMYKSESPRVGPTSLPLLPTQQAHLLNNQPLLSPPIQRLQGDSPSDNSYFSPIPPHEAELMLIRQKYKVKSSIPTDVSGAHYAEQCIAATVSSRLSPFSLHKGEYNLLRPYITAVHVTTYLNIRNGILRLWVSNPKVNVTRSEAAGCAREERFFNLAEVAYDWLVRNGYINFGCFEYPSFDFYNAIPEEQRKPRKTVVIIGAGIAGLSCARQLDNLFRRKARHFAEDQDVPRIVVIEGRRRIGGRIYSAHLKSDPSHAVDVGAHVIPGYGNGNPLAILIRRQLGLPIEKINKDIEIHDSLSRDRVSSEEQERARKLFDHLLERVAQFRNVVRAPKTAKGDEALIRSAKDPRDDYNETITIAKAEERGTMGDNQLDESDYKSDSEWVNENPGKIEVQFLKDIGIRLKPGVADDAAIHLTPEPQFGMYPSLGMSMDGLLRQLQEISEITAQELRLLNWYYANLENESATCLDNLSLGNWNQHAPKAFTGTPSIVKDGYISLARGLYTYPDQLEVQFKSSASVIEYSKDSAEIFLENEEQIKADCVVVTAPLGVLKNRTIQFIPDLPKWKTDSIEKLGFGVSNKVVLVYSRVFWDNDKDIIAISQPHEDKNRYEQDNYKNTRGLLFSFINMTKVTGKPCLVGVISGAAALRATNESDEMIVQLAQRSLEVAYPDARDTNLVESIVTRWQVDRFARGSCSYLGLDASGADYDLLARPIGKSLFFAGEATSRSHPATVHGAYLSGLRAANEVLTSLIGEIIIPHPLCPPKDYVPQVNGRYQPSHNTPGLTPNSSLVGTPNPRIVEPPQPLQISSVIQTTPMESVIRYPAPSNQYVPPVVKTVDENSPEAVLKRLKEERLASDGERMRADMIRELGELPMKPERSGANPFLIFQKDFWEKCRKECDAKKQEETKDPNAKVPRNDVRAALGKMWRELPDKEKEPYLQKTKDIKETNNKKSEEYHKKMKRYEAEADDFRRRWKIEHGSKPSEEEIRLQRIIQEEKQLEKIHQQQQQQQQQQKHGSSSLSSPPGGHKRTKYM